MQNSRRDYKRITKPIKSIGEYGSSQCNFQGPQGIKVDPWSQNIYVAEGISNRIQVFNSQLDFLFEFSVKRNKFLFTPCGICIFNRLVFVATGVAGMYIFTIEGELVTSFYPESNSIYRTIKAVAIDKDGECYVCDRAGNQVVVLNNRLAMAEVFVKGINHPCDIKLLENTVLVLKEAEKILSVFSREGKLLQEKIKKSREGRVTEFFDVDRWGVIFINSSSESRIKIYNRSAELIHEVSGPFFNNRGIAVDANSRIISICEYENNRLKIF